MRRAARVEVTAPERAQLVAWAGSGPARERRATRARIVLGAAEGLTNAQIASRLGVHLETAARWRSRFLATGLEGVSREAPRAGAAARVLPATVRRILRATLGSARADGRRWTTRSLARSLRVNHMLVHRVWAAHGLRERRRAPGSVPAVRPRVDVGGTFVSPRARLVVFTVDDRPAGGPARPLPELVPNPTSNPEFSGPVDLAEEVVRTVARAEGVRPRRAPGSSQEAALLVFLRGIERAAPSRLRFEIVLDRPVGRLGRRVGRWLASHPRFAVFSRGNGQRWADSVGAWLRRWEVRGLDAGSLAAARSFSREFPARGPVRRTARLGPVRLSWEARTTLALGPVGTAPLSPEGIGGGKSPSAPRDEPGR